MEMVGATSFAPCSLIFLEMDNGQWRIDNDEGRFGSSIIVNDKGDLRLITVWCLKITVTGGKITVYYGLLRYGHPPLQGVISALWRGQPGGRARI